MSKVKVQPTYDESNAPTDSPGYANIGRHSSLKGGHHAHALDVEWTQVGTQARQHELASQEVGGEKDCSVVLVEKAEEVIDD
ncbi:hypothetical protein EGR_01089 [Echinococcus granulosus]|uniref:Uncharacterized protein n=1 Tax=Echinococcus granulosus TaxID=6210 RepID=W6UTI9_ECHGR|nr:hypothetical protein EGR_01089 [Echinococcus granulosus]EUB63961.1 hypothetical protein EGR_01089 [Echinococcus granulosus]